MSSFPAPPPPPPQDPDVSLAALSALLDDAERRLTAGMPVDLTPLPDRMLTLCTALQALPKPDAVARLDDLRALMARLDALEKRLRQNSGTEGPA